MPSDRVPRHGVIWQGSYHGNARNGRFELHGLDPDTDVPVYFLEPKRKLGATVHLSGKSAAGGPMTVRLEPCGTAQARLVDPNGQPLAGYQAQYLISMIVTPGAVRGSPDPADAKRLLADADYLTRIDSINYLKEPMSDAQGRIVFPALIPGATYRISAGPEPARRQAPAQGLHRQARRDPRPGRYPDRETSTVIERFVGCSASTLSAVTFLNTASDEIAWLGAHRAPYRTSENIPVSSTTWEKMVGSGAVSGVG